MMSKEDMVLNNILKAYHYDVETLAKNIWVWRINFTDYIEIDGTSENPYLSAFMVNTLSEEFIKYYRQVNYNQSKESIAFLERLMDQKQQQLQDKRNQLEFYKSSNQVLDVTAESQSQITQINNYELAKNEAERKINATTLQLKSVTARINSMKSGQSQSDNSRLVELRNKISDLNARYIQGGLDNPQLMDSINLLRNEYTAERNKITSGADVNSKDLLTDLINKKFELETELEIAHSNLRDINSKLAQLKATASNFAGKESQITELQKTVDALSEEYRNLQEKLNNAKNMAMASSGPCGKY